MDPRETYAARLADRREELARVEKREDRLSSARLLVVFAGAGLCWPVFAGPRLPPELLGLPIVLFVVTLIAHVLTQNRRDCLLRSIAFYERGLAHLDNEWPGTGRRGDRYLDPDHPYAGELDIFGMGSLFERISAARTRAGEDTLAAWLCGPTDPETIEARQAAALDLKNRIDLREQIALLGEEVSPDIDATSLEAWGVAPPVLTSKVVPFLAGAFGLIGLVALYLWFGTSVGGLPLAGVVVIDALVLAYYRKELAAVLKTADHSATELALISEVLLRFEREEFEAPLLLALRRRLETDGEPPSRRLRKLVRLGQLVDAGRNQLFLPFAILLLWPLQCAFALERWRRTSGEYVGDWLRAVGEIEALLSVAGYAFERPDDPFPEIETEGPVFSACEIGHPLLPVDRCVRNDLTLEDDLRLVVISGSNMSGKSTLLRTVGTNAVLALLGAPVTAESLRISPLTIGASLRVVDSLLEGRSRFYAEITRLKQVVDLTDGKLPVIFLLDELLHGTNSKDRAAGAQAIVGGLVERGAIGLVTTHDLALSSIADSPGSRAANHHFEDRMEGDEMIFDYRLRPGVVTRSNALALMRAIGLDV